MVPIGAAFRIIPNMVAAKIANRCQASGDTPCGTGINQIINAKAKVIPIFFMSTSFIICMLVRLQSTLNL
ncbi:hypothetical protein D3C71_2064200 [compost metagenome]